jgi:hypothetical protein
VRITECELDHLAHDADHNVTHAILLVTLENGEQRHLEVPLPTGDYLTQDPASLPTKDFLK